MARVTFAALCSTTLPERGRTMNRRSLLLTPFALPLLASCASVEADQTTTLNAVVETVDPRSREILLRGNAGAQSGALVTMVVSPVVQRLNEIHSGDRVTVRYFQGIAAQVVRPSSPRNPPFAGVEVDRRETAERPGGQVTRVRSGRVTITAVDAVAGTVSFVGPDGFQRTVTTTTLQTARLHARPARGGAGRHGLRGSVGGLRRTHAVMIARFSMSQGEIRHPRP